MAVTITVITQDFLLCGYKHTSSHTHDTFCESNKELLRAGIEPATHCTAVICQATAPSLQDMLYYVAIGCIWLSPIIFIGTHSLALVETETDSAKL
ncbi:hypothetical protein SFRURICE_009781 [Spodoptera frugiperda]|nr:hypothetical protein SFRURICE_009781 [Spodoptera frugiperda]